MDIHQNARLTPFGRESLAKKVLFQGSTLNSAAAEFNVTPRTAGKWVRRYLREGRSGMRDRSSRPHRSPHRTPKSQLQQVEQLRRLRWPGCRIAQHTRLSRATVSRILHSLGLHRLRFLEPSLPPRRYEHPTPGSLVHFDIKKLARFTRPAYRAQAPGRRHSCGAGWEYLHVAIDDHSRIAFAQLLPRQSQPAAASFLLSARAFFASLHIPIQRIMTDNGGCYVAHPFRRLCSQLSLKHIFTRPYTPRTNGKAERFIQTALREWVHAHAYHDSIERAAQLPLWLYQYNHHRPHASLGLLPPISRSPSPDTTS